MNTCGECKYWQGRLEDDDGVEAYGECRRYPPTTKQTGAIVQMQSYSNTIFTMDTSKFETITYRSDWCGEFQQFIKEYTLD